MKPFAPLPLVITLAACSPKPAVDTNVRTPGEPETISRELTASEQREAIGAMASAQPPGFVPQPLVKAGERGRWRDVREVVIAAVKSCEVAMVAERQVPGGRKYDLRAIDDERGILRVTGSEGEGVTGVQVEMGMFGNDHALADRIARAFEPELRDHVRIPRPQ